MPGLLPKARLLVFEIPSSVVEQPGVEDQIVTHVDPEAVETEMALARVRLATEFDRRPVHSMTSLTPAQKPAEIATITWPSEDESSQFITISLTRGRHAAETAAPESTATPTRGRHAADTEGPAERTPVLGKRWQRDPDQPPVLGQHWRRDTDREPVLGRRWQRDPDAESVLGKPVQRQDYANQLQRVLAEQEAREAAQLTAQSKPEISRGRKLLRALSLTSLGMRWASLDEVEVQSSWRAKEHLDAAKFEVGVLLSLGAAAAAGYIGLLHHMSSENQDYTPSNIGNHSTYTPSTPNLTEKPVELHKKSKYTDLHEFIVHPNKALRHVEGHANPRQYLVFPRTTK
jgi:hypothetical protein